MNVVGSVARALDYCQQSDVAHCDIKPHNILLFDTRVAIHDFAIALRLSDGSDPFVDEGTIVGTFRYMSPERFTEAALTATADLYSLGVTAYECLFGVTPFPGPEFEHVITGHLSKPPPVTSFDSDDERRSFDDIVVHLLAKSPEDRFSSATHLLNALGPFSSSATQPPSAPAGPPEPYAGNGDYFFVSYSQRDIDRVGPLMERIARGGNNLWYDRGIPGGAEWDSMIEERIQSCIGIVLFLTEAAVESKFVRREVKFADAIDKRIVTLRLDTVELKHGLHMLLTQYQMLAPERVTASEISLALGYVHKLRDQVGGATTDASAASSPDS